MFLTSLRISISLQTVCGSRQRDAALSVWYQVLHHTGPPATVHALMIQRWKERWGEIGRRCHLRWIWTCSFKLVVSNVHRSHFWLIICLGSRPSIAPPSYVALLQSCHPLHLHLIISCNTLPLTKKARLASPHPPMCALRAIIIMPPINNASQYINKPRLQHRLGGGDKMVLSLLSISHYNNSFTTNFHSFALFWTTIKGLAQWGVCIVRMCGIFLWLPLCVCVRACMRLNVFFHRHVCMCVYVCVWTISC